MGRASAQVVLVRAADLPGAVTITAAAGAVVPVGPWALGVGGPETRTVVVCDLDADGRPEVLTDSELWSGASLAPGTLPQPSLERASQLTCLGDVLVRLVDVY